MGTWHDHIEVQVSIECEYRGIVCVHMCLQVDSCINTNSCLLVRPETHQVHTHTHTH